MAVLWAATKARLLPASRCPPTVGKLIHSSPPASAHLRAGVGHQRPLRLNGSPGGWERRPLFLQCLVPTVPVV